LQGLQYDYRARRTVQPALMEKTNKNGDLALRVEHYPDDGTEEPCVISVVGKDGSEFPVGIGTWADFDQQGRLVLASEGKLLAGAVANGKVVLTPLANFSNSTPNWERRNSLNRRGAENAEEGKGIIATDRKSDAHGYYKIINYNYLCASDFESVASNSFLCVLCASAIKNFLPPPVC
jgi:hypothetical protein